MDVNNYFLHRDLDEKVYMKLPHEHPQSSDFILVCCLHKSIYWLKQSARAWHAKLSTFLQQSRFSQSHVDFFLICLMQIK